MAASLPWVAWCLLSFWIASRSGWIVPISIGFLARRDDSCAAANHGCRPPSGVAAAGLSRPSNRPLIPTAAPFLGCPPPASVDLLTAAPSAPSPANSPPPRYTGCPPRQTQSHPPTSHARRRPDRATPPSTYTLRRTARSGRQSQARTPHRRRTA